MIAARFCKSHPAFRGRRDNLTFWTVELSFATLPDRCGHPEQRSRGVVTAFEAPYFFLNANMTQQEATQESLVQKALLSWIAARRAGRSQAGDRLTETLRALELIGDDGSGQLTLTEMGKKALAVEAG
jgi:hypothetical protein